MGRGEVRTEPYLYMFQWTNLFRFISQTKSTSAENLTRCELQLDATTELEEEQFKDKRWNLFAEHKVEVFTCFSIFQVDCF